MYFRPLRCAITLGLVGGLAACVLPLPVSVSSNAPALRAVQPTMAIGVGQERDLLPFLRIVGTEAVPLIPLAWEISNPALLTIEPSTGRAKGLKAGSVVVQVKAPGNDAGATQLIIEVLGEGSAFVKDVKVQPSSHQMAVGETVFLTAQVFMPDGQINGNVTWASSDNTIAAVNQTNGEASALKPGRVTIIAAYAPYPEFKAVADLIIYASRSEIPATPTPSSPRPSANKEENYASRTPAPVQPIPMPSALTSRAPDVVSELISPRPSPSEAPTQSPIAAAPSSVPSPSASVTSLPSPVTVTTFAGTGTRGFADGPGTAAQFYNPRGLATDTSGNVYVADQRNHRIRKITPDGVVSTLAGSTRGFADGPGTAAQFHSPSGVATDTSGNVYVADLHNHRIRKITPDGVVSTLAGSTEGFADGPGTAAQFSVPRSLAVDASGNVYVADLQNHRIRKITPDGVVSTLAGSTKGFADGTGAEAQFSGPLCVAVDATGNVYVTWLGLSLRKVTPEGVVSTLAGNATYIFPEGMAIDTSGNVYVADAGYNWIRKVTPEGIVSTLAGSGNSGFADGPGTVAQFRGPVGVAIDTSGNVYVADEMNHRIRLIRPATLKPP